MFGMVCFADQGMSGASVPCWVTLRLIQTRAVKVVNVGPAQVRLTNILVTLVTPSACWLCYFLNAAADLLLW